VASATPGNPDRLDFGQCEVEGGASGIIGPVVVQVDTNTTHGPFAAADERWLFLQRCSG
jgi:hypothetical protein